MKKFNNNGIFGKITALLNVVIFIFFVILMVLVMKFDKINVQYVEETPAFNSATDQLRAAEQPLKMDSVQIAHYQYRLDTLNQKPIPTDKKVAKEFNDEVKRIADLLKEKENLKAVHDSTLVVKKAEITPIEAHYLQTQEEMNSAKSTFTVFAYLVFCLFILKVALFAFWNYKNSKDIHNYSDWAKKSSSPFWAFVGWIIPVFDLIKPYSFFTELQSDTEYILKDKKLIPDDYDKNDYNDFYIGLWWGFFLLAVCLGTIFINNTFFDTATMYTKLGHGNVAFIVSLLWFVYLCLEVIVIFRYNKLSKLLYDNQDK